MRDLAGEKIDKIIKWAVLSILGVLSYLYSIFWSYFSEFNILFPFLNFPIFIGEFLFGFCLIAFFIKHKFSSVKLRGWHYFLFIYIVFVLFKAFYGYSKWGPLAFRNAALFYYPLFAVMGYYFFDRDFFRNKWVKRLILFLLVAVVYLCRGYKTFYFDYFMLTLVLFLSIENKILKYSFITLFLILCRDSLVITIIGGRNIMVSSFFGYLFIGAVLIFGFLKVKLRYKLSAVIVVFFIVCAVIWYGSGDKIAVKSLIGLEEIAARYKERMEIINSKKGNFKFANPPVKIYEKNNRFFEEKSPYGSTKEESANDKLRSYSRDKLITIILESEQKNYQSEFETIPEAVVMKLEPESKIIPEAVIVKSEPETKITPEAVVDTPETVIKTTPEIIDTPESEIRTIPEAIAVKSEPQTRTTPEAVVDTSETVIKTTPEVVVDMPESEIKTIPEAVVVKPEYRMGRKPKGIIVEREPKTETTPEAGGVKVESETKIIPVDKMIMARKFEKLSKEKLIEIILENEQVPFTGDKSLKESHPLILSGGKKVREGRSSDVLLGNILYRMFIWQDMMEEVFAGKKLLGADFGKPFRSHKLEISKFDESWKTRVGWVEPHNAYVHCIYRSGVVGLVSIFIVWMLFFKMVKSFVVNSNIRGILLSSCVLYWLIVTNFMVILELPHWAIPFWSLFGLTLKYSRLQEKPGYGKIK